MVLAVALISAVLGCSRGESSRITFDGESFRASAKPLDRSDRAVFDVTVRQVSKSVEGAREAAAYEATRYCIRWFGLSDVAWQVGPDTDPLPVANNTLTLRGRCLG